MWRVIVMKMRMGMKEMREMRMMRMTRMMRKMKTRRKRRSVMTEEQKMEEGKRMFSIFAARMFEQRVLQAYREKVAQERQLQLLRELEDEDKIAKEREAKKQNQSQKKKAKKMFVPFSLFVFVC
ncbi:hypothetical protein JAAARDRAFT_317944 [Jaapia argillacea MUCL 33604]|uniref:Uncharacterized protein n=1 Tax=Jaapia argillacea MUCL 33604 TaxID=933084 RepID=A0A067PMI8_9AGAM|nr:hypothetical protein JAAARDRAFT_317944 [Jaapia argillacea MUCL 33604]